MIVQGEALLKRAGLVADRRHDRDAGRPEPHGGRHEHAAGPHDLVTAKRGRDGPRSSPRHSPRPAPRNRATARDPTALRRRLGRARSGTVAGGHRVLVRARLRRQAHFVAASVRPGRPDRRPLRTGRSARAYGSPCSPPARACVVRINDRFPNHKGRVIDVSKAAAAGHRPHRPRHGRRAPRGDRLARLRRGAFRERRIDERRESVGEARGLGLREVAEHDHGDLVPQEARGCSVVKPCHAPACRSTAGPPSRRAPSRSRTGPPRRRGASRA